MRRDGNRMHSIGAPADGDPAVVEPGQADCYQAFERELDYLRRTLRRLGVPTADVEDELHEVFLVLDRNWKKFDQTRPLRPYLFGIAFRVVASRRRKSGREVAHPVEEYAVDGERSPEEALESSRARQLVLRALAKVPLERRAVLVLHDIDEVGMREIAQSLAIPLFTGYSRLRRGRQEFELAVRALRHQQGS